MCEDEKVDLARVQEEMTTTRCEIKLSRTWAEGVGVERTGTYFKGNNNHILSSA